MENTQIEKRYISLIEGDIKDIFFNSNNKNKDLSIKNLIPLFVELKQYMPYITQEYLINLLNSDNRKIDFSNAQITKKVFIVLKRLGLNKEVMISYKKTIEVLKYSVNVPIYEKTPIIEKKVLYPTITEKNFKGYSKDFKYMGEKKVNIGIEIKPLISEQFRKIVF